MKPSLTSSSSSTSLTSTSMSASSSTHQAVSAPPTASTQAGEHLLSSPTPTRAASSSTTAAPMAGSLASSLSSSGSSTGSQAAMHSSAAGGVLKRLRQLLWEGVSRHNEESEAPIVEATTSTASPKTKQAPSSAVQSSNVNPPSGQGAGTLQHEHLLKEALKRMNKNSALQTRLALVNELCEYARTYTISDVIKVWGTVKDLVNDDQPSYVRKLGYDVMRALIQGQYNNLGSLRVEFFSIIKTNTHSFVARLENLIALTKNGHEIGPFENDICQVLLTWLERGRQYTREIIDFASKVIKFNPYTIAEAPKTAFICHVCNVCNNTSDIDFVEVCLKFFDVLVRYSHVPERALVDFINALCRTLNIEAYCQTSWSLMTNLLKSPCGHQGIIALCSILGSQRNYHAVNLLRGAVFYLSMACWGSHRITSLHVTRSAVLPYMLRVLDSKHHIVAYEVALSINRLVKKYAAQMQVEWDLVLRIIRNLLPYLMGHEDDGQYSLLFAVQESLEIMHVTNKNFEYLGPSEALMELLEDFSTYCLEATAIELILEKKTMLHPAMDDWQHHLHRFLLCFFQRERRPAVQNKALKALEQIFSDFHVLYGDEIVKVVLPVFHAFYAGGTVALAGHIYKRGLDFLVYAASATKSDLFFEVVDVIRKALRSKSDRQRYDAIAALIRLFVKKFPKSRPTHTLHIFDQLIKLASDRHPTLRAKVIVFLLSFRANQRYLMQLNIHRPVKSDKPVTATAPQAAGEKEAAPNSGDTSNEPLRSKIKALASPLTSPRAKRESGSKKEDLPPETKKDAVPPSKPSTNMVLEVLTSPTLVCWRRSQPSSPPQDMSKKEKVGLFPVGQLMEALISALQIETTYEVFIVTVYGIIEMLKNYYILRAADMCSIASVLCKLLRSGTFGACIDPRVRSDKAARGKLLEVGYELLIMLIGYQAQLKPKYREYIISCLCEGLASNLLSIPPEYALAIQRTCINGLSVSLSELPESMGQRISAIVGDLYKVCERNFESKQLAMPAKSELARHILEFFSFLLDAPTIMAALKDDDRQRLFLTLMLLTDPTEFAPHVANQAYIVWADFFMESPIPLRLGYYRTAANYLMQRMMADSRGSPATADANLLLMATLDLFAQSVFGNCENTPLPLPDSAFLFDNAQTRKWAQGNCIVSMRVGRMGWVEIVVRRPAGSQRWIMQLQNITHQMLPPVNVAKSDEQLRQCIEEAPWMFTHLKNKDDQLGRDKQVPDRASSDNQFQRGQAAETRSFLAVDSGHIPTRPRKQQLVAKRSLSAPLIRGKPALLEVGEYDQLEQGADALSSQLTRTTPTSSQPSTAEVASATPAPSETVSTPLNSSIDPKIQEMSGSPTRSKDSSSDTPEQLSTSTSPPRSSTQDLPTTNVSRGDSLSIASEPEPVSPHTSAATTLSPQKEEESARTERKWTDVHEPIAPTKIPTPDEAKKGKERIEHWRKKFISKVKTQGSAVKLVLPEVTEEGPDQTAQAEPTSTSSELLRRRSWSEPDEPIDLYHKIRRAQHKRNASTVEHSLSVFYPPLPSYEGTQEEKSPPLYIAPKQSSEAMLWQRGRCVSREHVNLKQQTLSIEGQMLLHSLSSSPQPQEPPVLLRTSPPSSHKPEGQIASEEKPSTSVSTPVHPVQPTPNDRTETRTEQVLRSLSLELEDYTPPAQTHEDEESNLSLANEVQTLLPPDFNISPSSMSTAATEASEDTSKSSTQSALSGSDVTVSATLDTHAINSAFEGSNGDNEQSQLVSPSRTHFDPASPVSVPESLSSADAAVELLAPSKGEKDEQAPKATTEESEKSIPVQATQSIDIQQGTRDDKSKRNIKKEKDELMLVGDGLILPSPSGVMLQNLEADEEGIEIPAEEPGFISKRILAADHAKDSSPYKPAVAEPTPKDTKTKVRRTSILHLFTSPSRKSNPTQQAATSAIAASNSAYKPFKIPTTRFDNHPSFVYSQMKNIPFIDDHPPRELKSNDEALTRALAILDRTPTTVCVKVGIIYVGDHQHTEEQILANTAGSPRYFQLLNRLGEKIRLKDTTMYAGGLDTREDTDGHYTLHWRSVSTQVVYHVVTMIPNRIQLYPQFQNKKRHIGNDNVNIVYSDSPKEFKQDTIPGQFNFVHIVVHPLKEGFYRVEIKKKPQVPSFGPIANVQIVSERAMATLVRQVALSANLAACLVQDPQLQRYSNLEERLRQLRKIGERFAKPE